MLDDNRDCGLLRARLNDQGRNTVMPGRDHAPLADDGDGGVAGLEGDEWRQIAVGTAGVFTGDDDLLHGAWADQRYLGGLCRQG
jgi:hypothetical protein